MKMFAPAVALLLLSAAQPASAQWQPPDDNDGFTAGYFWALRNNITEAYRCDRFNDAFRAGCNAFARGMDEDDEEEDEDE